MNAKKYQGMKEFHLLPCMGCYCKMVVFSPFKLEIPYYHLSKSNKQWCPFQPLKNPKMHCKNQIPIIIKPRGGCYG